MRLLPVAALLSLAACTGQFERNAQAQQRRAAALQSATLVVEYHRNGEDLAHPDTAADQRVIDAFMAGCGMTALRRFDQALTQEIPYAVLSRDDGQARMMIDAGAFDAEASSCFSALHARGRVTWIVAGRELGALQVAGEMAAAVAYPEGHSTSWVGLGGCGSRGGPGYRLSSGKCASWAN